MCVCAQHDAFDTRATLYKVNPIYIGTLYSFPLELHLDIPSERVCNVRRTCTPTHVVALRIESSDVPLRDDDRALMKF